MKRGYWTKEKCQEVALRYQNRRDFKLNCSGAFDFCKRNNYLDEVCSHMGRLIKPKGYWTFERCEEVARSFNRRSDFSKKFPGAYRASTYYDWLDEICSHMTILGNMKKRAIYLFEFSDKSVYIGLTCDVDRRYREHIDPKLNSIIYQYKMKNNIEFNFIVLEEYTELSQATELEKYYIELYRANGYNILNKKRGGEVGKIDKTIWTYDKCKEESLKYKSRTEFHDKKGIAYRISVSNGWIDDFYKSISSKLNIDYNICKEESLKYKNRSEFSRRSRTIYNYCSKNGWLDEFYKK